MTRNTAVEYADQGIRINAICPGNILPPAQAVSQRRYPAPAGRGTPDEAIREVDEIANCAVFLASEASSFMTGALLSVDGGWTAL